MLVVFITGIGGGVLRSASVEAVWPLENGLRWFWRGASLRVSALLRAQETVTRLQRLEDEVEQLRLDARMLEDLAAENRELRQAAGLPVSTLRRTLKCEVLSWGGTLGWWQSLTINRGYSDGVRVGDAVVCADGLVGKVKKVNARTADVLLITDENSRISCLLELPDGEGDVAVRGILRGSGWKAPDERFATESFLFTVDLMRLEYLGRSAIDSGRLAARTRVVTSGLGETFPRGITVGWLVEAELDEDGLYGVGRVLPAVDFAAIRSLTVLASGGGE